MNIQNIVAAVIILSALAYIASTLWKKIKAFKPSNQSCSSDCGCAVKSPKI